MMFDHELPIGGPGGRMFDNHFTTNEGYPDWLTTNPKIVEETERSKSRCREVMAMKIKVVNAGNCMICGKPIKLVVPEDSDKFPNIFFCKELEPILLE